MAKSIFDAPKGPTRRHVVRAFDPVAKREQDGISSKDGLTISQRQGRASTKRVVLEILARAVPILNIPFLRQDYEYWKFARSGKPRPNTEIPIKDIRTAEIPVPGTPPVREPS